MKKTLLTLALSAATLTSFAIDYPGSISGKIGSDNVSTDAKIVISAANSKNAVIKLQPFTLTLAGYELTTPELSATPTTAKEGMVMSYTASIENVELGQAGPLNITATINISGTRDAETGELQLAYTGTATAMGQSQNIDLTFKGTEDPGFTCPENPIEGKIYFQDDFEFLNDWSKGAYDKTYLLYPGNTVGQNDVDVYCPQIPTPKFNEVSVLDALKEKGYDVVRIEKSGNTNPGECIYYQRNYLKFGKSGYQGGIVLPAVEGAEGKTLSLNFFWCTMRQGSGTMDPTGLVVLVANGDDVKEFAVPAHGLEKGADLKWINADITLEGANITPETKITIRPDADNWGKSGQHRWFIDNIALYNPSEMGAIGEIEADDLDANAPVEYFNIQGMRVNADNLPAGLYIRRQGSKASKIYVK